MHVDIPKQLSPQEELLKSKLAILKKKKKEFLEAKSNKEQLNLQAIGTKRKSIDTPISQADAKETAKKLVKSGVIKLEAENKEKGFKRPVSRKDDAKKSQFQSSLEPEPNPFLTTTSLRFNKTDSPVSSPSFQRKEFKFNKNRSFGNKNRDNCSLHIKANNLTEDLLKNAFNSHVPDVALQSIDMKIGYAFVSVETKEMGEKVIKNLNGQSINDSQLQVSFARPRKTFDKNRSYDYKSQNNLNEEQSSNFALKNWNDITQSSTNQKSSEANRSLISYDNDHELFEDK